MNTQQSSIENTQQQNTWTNEQALSVSSGNETYAAYAESLLDQVDTAQLQIQHLQNDTSLLKTAENALDLISENLAKVRRMVMEKQKRSEDRNFLAEVNHEIRNLLMINMLIVEDTEANGHYLFRDNIIRMSSCSSIELTLTTARIPEIAGIDTNDTQATLDSLDNAARTINRQYSRIAELMRALLTTYKQSLSQMDLLLTAQIQLRQRTN